MRFDFKHMHEGLKTPKTCKKGVFEESIYHVWSKKKSRSPFRGGEFFFGPPPLVWVVKKKCAPPLKISGSPPAVNSRRSLTKHICCVKIIEIKPIGKIIYFKDLYMDATFIICFVLTHCRTHNTLISYHQLCSCLMLTIPVTFVYGAHINIYIWTQHSSFVLC